jgi:hypothetical protein
VGCLGMFKHGSMSPNRPEIANVDPALQRLACTPAAPSSEQLITDYPALSALRPLVGAGRSVNSII